jgi:hypothetical protein
VVVVGAVFIGGQLMRSVPREQTLIFPVGSVFPNATRFAASWKQPGEDEARGGVSLSFTEAPPLQIREHAKLPDGDYIVTIDILQAPSGAGESSAKGEGLQTNFERRVSLAGGETLIALTDVPREPSISE